MSRLFLKHLAYLGPNKTPASIAFEPGLNVICGSSETGKSLIVESIDFMLGGSEPPRDLPERAGYDRVRLLIESEGWPILGLERSIEGGNFLAYEEELREGEPTTEATVLRERHSSERQDTLSYALLNRLGLTDKRVRRNSAGVTRSVSMRDLVRLVVVTEGEIQRQTSPLLSGQWVNQTPEYAAFKLILTGMDDSALVSAREVSERREAVSGKLELLEEMIAEIQTEIEEEGLDEKELQDQLDRLEAGIDEQNSALNEVQAILDDLLEERGAVADDIRRRRARLLEIQELTGRFKLLDEHYASDLKRLEAIHESGSMFVHLDRGACPLCGADPGDQHLDSDCDGNTEEVVVAATAEMEKIQRLQRELRDTVDSLEDESETINVELPALEGRYKECDDRLSSIVRPAVSTSRTSYNELIATQAEVKTGLDKFKRLEQLALQKERLEAGGTDSEIPSQTQTAIPRAPLDEFSQTVERILSEWHFPNASRVFFDESNKDFQIAGKERGSTGKGLRAVTHAAVTVGLLEFCLQHELPHPGFVVLDSPLLAYWKPEGEEDDLRGTDLKEKFYSYLLGLQSNAEIVIIENEHPPQFVYENGNVVAFTKNPHQGRYGFFPAN